MLYVTTRNNQDVRTAHHALSENRGSDGGLYIPFRDPVFSREDIEKFSRIRFNDCVAEVLNTLFQTSLTGWDVDFCVGKNLCKTIVMNHRIAVAELWHNQQRDFDWLLARLAARLKDRGQESDVANNWVRLVVRIASVFGVFSELHRSGTLEKDQVLDIAVPADDFSQAVAAWYARYLGLNVGTILCACCKYSNSWDLFNYGQMRTDAVPGDLERLIYLSLGHEEAKRFASLADSGKVYTLNAEQTDVLRNGIFSAVIGAERIGSIIPRVQRTNEYLMAPMTALAFGGIQDYRAKNGEIRPTLILAEKSPACCADDVAKAMGMTVQQLKDRFSLD